MPYRQVDLPQFLAALKAVGAKTTKRDLRGAGLRTTRWHVKPDKGPSILVGMTMVMWPDRTMPPETVYMLWDEPQSPDSDRVLDLSLTCDS